MLYTQQVFIMTKRRELYCPFLKFYNRTG